MGCGYTLLRWKRKRPREAAGVVIYVDSIGYSYQIVKWNCDVAARDISLLRSSAGVRTTTQPLRAGLRYATPSALVCGYGQRVRVGDGRVRGSSVRRIMRCGGRYAAPPELGRCGWRDPALTGWAKSCRAVGAWLVVMIGRASWLWAGSGLMFEHSFGAGV